MKYSRLSIISIITGIISIVAGTQLIFLAVATGGIGYTICNVIWQIILLLPSFSVTAIVTGVLGVKRTTLEKRKGKDMAKTGIILGILSPILLIIGIIILILPYPY